MKTNVFLGHLILFLGVIWMHSCTHPDMDKATRRQYLEEHVENCSQISLHIFSRLDYYTVIHRDNAYIEKFKEPVKACTAFFGFLDEELYTKTKNDTPIDKSLWQKTDIQQQNVEEKVLQLIPPFLRREIPSPTLELATTDDSDELRIAKYFSNCQRISHTLLQILILTEDPSQGKTRRHLDFLNVLTAMDTVRVGQPFHAMGSLSLLEDYRKYTAVQSIQDLQLLQMDSPAGHFVFRITGPRPRVNLVYFDVHNLKEINHEINF